MKINYCKGMVNIESDHISYGNIRGMYVTGDGHGLQLDGELEPHREKIQQLCQIISSSIYQLESICDNK